MSLPTRSRFLRSLTAPSTTPSAGFSCGICLEIPNTTSLVAPHNDKHLYCRPCLIRWLGESNNCPECRKVLFRKRRGMRPEQYRRLDSVRLTNILGWDYYQELLSSDVGSAGLIEHFLQETLRRLGERLQMYDQGSLVQDVLYNIPRILTVANIPIEGSMPESEDEDEEMEVEEENFNLDASRLISTYFAGWWEVFTTAPRGAMIHHPLATHALQLTIHALLDWDGYRVAGMGLGCMLRIRLRQGNVPEEWMPHLNEVVGNVVSAFEGITKNRSKLSVLQGKALAEVEAHEPLWNAFLRM